jgi:hypothetical protein
MTTGARYLPWKGKTYWNLGTYFIILGVLPNFIRIPIELN